MLTVVDAASRSISLDGINDHVKYNANFSEDPIYAISIEAWIYLYTNTTDMAILSYGNDAHDSIVLEHKNYNMEMRLKSVSNTEFVNFRNLTADELPQEKWGHVCVVWDNTSNKSRYFLNGQLQYEDGLAKAIFMITINMLGDTLTCSNLFCRFINTTI